MNLVAIKKRYSDFISSFDPNDLQLLMYFTELVLEKYNDSPTKLLGIYILLQSYLHATIIFINLNVSLKQNC